MAKYEKLTEKATIIETDHLGATCYTILLRGIVSAILALAEAVKDGAHEIASQIDSSKHAGHGGR